MSKIAIFGSSYVVHLEADLKVRHCDVRWFGASGLCIDQIFRTQRFKQTLDDLKKYQPDTVYLCCGGNDVTFECRPADIVERIRVIVDHLYETGVKTVLVQALIPRASFRDAMNTASFLTVMRAVNSRLHKMYRRRYVHFQPNLNEDYKKDKIHLNNKGLGKHFVKVRNAILRSSEC